LRLQGENYYVITKALLSTWLAESGSVRLCRKLHVCRKLAHSQKSHLVVSESKQTNLKF